MDVFEHIDYKAAIRSYVSSLPREGRGELGRISRSLRIHPTLISQVLHGKKHLTLEQACLLTEHMGLDESGSDYFLGLVEAERAGSEKLKRRISKRLAALQATRLEIKNRLPKEPKPLTELEQAIFYSDWYYSAIRLLTSIANHGDVDGIAKRLNIPKSTVGKAVGFLLESGLCITKKNKIEMGPKRTHIAKDSPFIRAHHRNWRLRCMQKLDASEQDDLFFTAPLTISKADAKRLQKRLLDVIAEAGAIVDPSTPEDLHCLNIDFFKV